MSIAVVMTEAGREAGIIENIDLEILQTRDFYQVPASRAFILSAALSAEAGATEPIYKVTLRIERYDFSGSKRLRLVVNDGDRHKLIFVPNFVPLVLFRECHRCGYNRKDYIMEDFSRMTNRMKTALEGSR